MMLLVLAVWGMILQDTCRTGARCPGGASRVFSPQKGASAAQAELMDRWMEDYAHIVQSVLPGADPAAKGAGAAGGLGFALQAFLGGRMISGAEVLIDRCGIGQEIASADLVITGEGRIDGQTAMGKAPARIAAAAKKYNKPVIAIGGCLTKDAVNCHAAGIDAVFPIVPDPLSGAEAMNKDTAKENIARTACELARLIHQFIINPV